MQNFITMSSAIKKTASKKNDNNKKAKTQISGQKLNILI